MKKNIFLILSLFVAMQAGAQLTVRDYGNVEIGTNPEYPYPSGFNVTHADTVTALKIFGGGAMATGARIAATSEMSAGRRTDFVRKTMQAPQRGAPLGHIIEKGESASKRNFPARPLKFLFEAHIVSPAIGRATHRKPPSRRNTRRSLCGYSAPKLSTLSTTQATA